jgi:hypothetical protein
VQAKTPTSRRRSGEHAQGDTSNIVITVIVTGLNGAVWTGIKLAVGKP